MNDQLEHTNENIIQIIDGNIPMIVSVPHGGLLEPEKWPNRSCKCANPEHKKCPVILINDGFTIDLAKAVSNSIEVHSQGSFKPYLVINHVCRAKLDPNRDIEIGAQDDMNARKAHEEYHSSIERTKATFKKPGLLVDLHGRVGSDGITQLGYCISRADLNSGNINFAETSLSQLSKRKPSLDLIRGSHSFGAFMENESLKSTPSPSIPIPDPDIVYFPGGYIIQRHANDIDGIQVETPRDLRIEGGQKGREKFGFDLGKAVFEFYKTHYV